MNIRLIASNATLKTTSSQTFIDVEFAHKIFSWKLIIKNGKPFMKKLSVDENALDVE